MRRKKMIDLNVKKRKEKNSNVNRARLADIGEL